MKTVAIIPVKSTSSRILSKNIKLLGNMPLFLHTLDKSSSQRVFKKIKEQ